MSFHLVGFIKKIFVVSTLVLLSDRAEVAVIIYVVVQVLYLILLFLIRPMVNLVLNLLKILSELTMLGVLVVLLMMFQSVNRIKEQDIDPRAEDVAQYLDLGYVINYVIVAYVCLQVLVFWVNIFIQIKLHCRKTRSDNLVQSRTDYLEKNRNLF